MKTEPFSFHDHCVHPLTYFHHQHDVYPISIYNIYTNVYI